MASNSVQLTVDGDCDCLMQESTDVVLCLSDGWETKTLTGTKFVLGTIVSVNEKCTSIKKGNCCYPGVKSCEYIVDVLLDQFEAIDPDDEDSDLWEPESDDVESVTKSNCFYSTIIDTLVTHGRVSDDEQNLITILEDGVFASQSTIVNGYSQSGESTAFPITTSVTITNPSNYLPMRVMGNMHFFGRFSLIANAGGRTITREIEIDSVSVSGPSQVVIVPSATSSAMNSNAEWFEDLGDLTNLNDGYTLLNPGDSKTYTVTFNGTLISGDTADSLNVQLTLVGINFSPLA